MKLVSAALVFGLCAAAQSPRIFYSKSFPRSAPPYSQVTVERDGSSVYMEDLKDEQPLKFKLTETEVSTVFSLASKLDNFKRPLESGLKVANLGQKTFRYENGTEKGEQKFNYSTDETARVLLDVFERIVDSERLLIDLERTVRFDRIGVNQAVMDLAVAFDKKRLVAPEQFLPMLDRIVNNDAFVHLARQRAASLADAFRGQKPKSE